MNRFIPIAAVLLTVVVPALAQQVVHGPMPSALSADQVTSIQKALNKRGFSSGPVDGIWGPNTQAAVQNFQRRQNLQPTGLANTETMAALGLGHEEATHGSVRPIPPTPHIAVPAAPVSTPAVPPVPVVVAPQIPSVVATPVPAPTPPASTAAPVVAPARPLPAQNGGNAPVTTTGANASRPATGANSFTEEQARERISAQGYQQVGSLNKDEHGVWRGTAMKNGQRANVWLDFKGDAGAD